MKEETYYEAIQHLSSVLEIDPGKIFIVSV